MKPLAWALGFAVGSLLAAVAFNLIGRWVR
jgi:hypothetical protein